MKGFLLGRTIKSATYRKVLRYTFPLWLWCIPLFALPTGRGCEQALRDLADLLAENRFTLERSLYHYAGSLPHAFRQSLARLTADEQWLDSGSGAGVALAEYQAARKLKPRGAGLLPEGVVLPEARAKTVGVTFAKPEEAAPYEEAVKAEIDSGRHRILTGRLLEAIPAEEIGPTKLLTDFYGPLTYTTDLATVINRYLEISAAETDWFLFYGYGHTYIRTREGKTLSIHRYLRERLPEAEVVENQMQTPEGAHVHFSAKPTSRIPPLKLVAITSGRPPIRTFQEAP